MLLKSKPLNNDDLTVINNIKHFITERKIPIDNLLKEMCFHAGLYSAFMSGKLNVMIFAKKLEEELGLPINYFLSYQSTSSSDDMVMGMDRYAFTYTHGKEIMGMVEFGRKIMKNMEELDELLKEKGVKQCF